VTTVAVIDGGAATSSARFPTEVEPNGRTGDAS
jgi:hypothetical protein